MSNQSNAHAKATLQLLREAKSEGIDVDDDLLAETEAEVQESSDESNRGDSE